MLKRSLIEGLATAVVVGAALLTVAGLESLPQYLMDYLVRSGLVYQGY